MAKIMIPCLKCGQRTKKNGYSRGKERRICTNIECRKTLTISNEPLAKEEIIDFWLHAKRSTLLSTSEKFGISPYILRKVIKEQYIDALDFGTETKNINLTRLKKLLLDMEKKTAEYSAVFDVLKNIIIGSTPDNTDHLKEANNLSDSKFKKIFRYALNNNCSLYSLKKLPELNLINFELYDEGEDLL